LPESNRFLHLYDTVINYLKKYEDISVAKLIPEDQNGAQVAKQAKDAQQKHAGREH